MKLCEAETEPEDAEKAGNALVETLIKGEVSGRTVPLTAKVLSEAPLLDTAKFPDKEGFASVAAATRTVTMVGATETPDRRIARGKEV